MITPVSGIYHYRYQMEPDESGTVKSILTKRYGYSSRVIAAVKRAGQLLVNGKPALFTRQVGPGDVVDVHLPPETCDTEPIAGTIDIVYEDNEVLVLNKAPFTVMHPTAGHPTDTLANYAAHYLRQKGEDCKIRFVNRLDRDTSGIVVIAKNKFVHHYIQSRMTGPEVRKSYTAFVENAPEPRQGTIDLPIRRAAPDSIERVVSADGLASCTRYRTAEVFAGASEVDCTLETGRTHQIRVHMKAVGCPIIGDPLYNPQSVEAFDFGRQALHARSLSLPLPKTGDHTFTAPLPEDMDRLKEQLRRRT